MSYYVTLATPRIVSVTLGEPKCYMKKTVSLARVTLAYRGETTRPPELSRPSRWVRDPLENGQLNFVKK